MNQLNSIIKPIKRFCLSYGYVQTKPCDSIFLILTALLVVACKSPESKSLATNSTIDSLVDKSSSISKDTIVKELNNEFMEFNEVESDGYKFKFGYIKYDEEKFGFSNPGLLQVRKNGRVVLIDSFKGEGEVYMKSHGYHKLSGNKLVFTLNWGTEACDYWQHSRYYTITPEDKVFYLGEYLSASGGDGYASRYFEHIFPEDTAGRIDSLLIVEGIKFHERDQPDLFDTTHILFDGDKYNINKPTNNLEKAR